MHVRRPLPYHPTEQALRSCTLCSIPWLSKASGQSRVSENSRACCQISGATSAGTLGEDPQLQLQRITTRYCAVVRVAKVQWVDPAACAALPFPVSESGLDFFPTYVPTTYDVNVPPSNASRVSQPRRVPQHSTSIPSTALAISTAESLCWCHMVSHVALAWDTHCRLFS